MSRPRQPSPSVSSAFQYFAEPPVFPGLPSTGPSPEDIDADAPAGMRFPLTTPPGGGKPARAAGLGFRTYFQIIEVDYDACTKGTLVDG